MLNKSLDTILSNFAKTMDELDKFITSTNAKKDEKLSKAAALESEAQAHAAEINKATGVRENIAKLLGQA